MKRFFLTSCLLAIAAFSLSAQTLPELTLEDIYLNRLLPQRGMTAVRWLKDNRSYSTLESNSRLLGQDIVKNDAATGSKKILVDASLLVPQGQKKPLRISDYIWSEDNDKLLIFTNTSRVWRYNSKGDYWVLDLKKSSLSQIGTQHKPSSMLYAKFSPQADKVAYVYANNIYVEDLTTHLTTQLTNDGCDYIINGTFDWVYEEELSCRDGFRWSPDGKTIAYWQSDTRGTGVFHMINNVDSLYSKVITFPYPKAGTTNSAVKVGVVSVEGGATHWLDIPGDARNNYLARMEFIPKSNDVMIQQLNRLQNTNHVYVANVLTHKVECIMTESDAAFLDLHSTPIWLDGEKWFTWTSESDSWRHLYKVSRDGKRRKLITSGDFDVIHINCIDTRGGYVYYMASPSNATQQYLYRSPLDGKGPAERVTPLQSIETGTHSYQLSSDARWAIHTFQNCTTPTQYDIVALPEHRTVRIIENNLDAKRKYASFGFNAKEFFRVDIGPAVLDGWMIKPRNFDPSLKYPVIFQIYGEPASSTVQNTWGGGDLWHQYLAQQGYIIMSIDPRGTNMPKGREWRKSIYGKVGIVAPADHAAALKEVLKQYPFLDGSRVGIWGWSGGGSMTLNAMFRYPELYHTGIAVAFVALQELYDTIYQERYMGLPSENVEGYRDGSPINHAQNLQGNLLLIHGTGDDNVHYQNCEMLVNRLIASNKYFSMMSYPMRSHGIYEYPNTTYHLYKTMATYWLDHLPAGGVSRGK